MPVSEINKIYAERVPGALWRVRYFRDSQPEEYAITLKPDGSLQGFWHTLPEAAKGANLSKEEAIGVADKFLSEKKQIDLSGWKLVQAESDKRPNRTDTTLTWQQDAALDPSNPGAKDPSDHAYARIEMKVLGDEPADFRSYVKIPETFVRQQDEQTLARTLVFVGQTAVGLGLLVGVLLLYFKNLRQTATTVPWRRLFGWSCIGMGAAAVSFFLGRGIPGLLSGYQTSMPMRLFVGTVGVGVFLLGALGLGLLTLAFGLAWSFGSRAFGEEQLPTWFAMPANYYRDAFWIAVGGSALLIGVRRILDFASLWWPTHHRELPADFGAFFDALFPGAGLIGGSLFHGLFAVAFLGLAAAFISAELRARWLRLFLFFAVAAAMVGSWGSLGDFLKQFMAGSVLLAIAVFGIRRVVRFNILGLFLIAVCTALLGSASTLLAQPNTLYRRNGYLLLFASLVLLAWPLILWRLRGNVAAVPQSEG